MTDTRNSQRTVVIVQARMSSRRLPGKVLLELAGKAVLWHVVERAKRIFGVDDVVVATSFETSDDPIEDWCEKNDVNVFRGPLDDVLARFSECALETSAQTVIRITADCPVLDSQVSSLVLKAHRNGANDYSSLAQGAPDGLDTQVFSRRALDLAHKGTSDPNDREHVGTFFEKNPGDFELQRVKVLSGLQNHRWTLDNAGDYEFLTTVFDRLFYSSHFFGYERVLDLLEEEPGLFEQSIQTEAQRLSIA